MRGVRVLVMLVMCVMFMSSCSWMRRVRASVRRHLPTSTKVQPAPEQQKAAMELLRRMDAERSENASRGQGEDGRASQSSSGRGADEPSRETEQPSATLPGVNSQGLPGMGTGEYGGDEWGSTPRAVDPAMQHGLRSPSLPKLLPMDMDGKLTPGI